MAAPLCSSVLLCTRKVRILPDLEDINVNVVVASQGSQTNPTASIAPSPLPAFEAICMARVREEVKTQRTRRLSS